VTTHFCFKTEVKTKLWF